MSISSYAIRRFNNIIPAFRYLFLITCLILLIELLKNHRIIIQPKHGAYVDNDKIQIGSVPAGEQKEFLIKVNNNLQRSLRILGSKMSCNCTTINNIPNFVPSQSSTDLTVGFTPSSTQRGRYVGLITLYTDDPGNYQINVEFEAFVGEPTRSSASDGLIKTAVIVVLVATDHISRFSSDQDLLQCD